MSTRPASDHLSHRVTRALRSRPGLAVLVAIALPVAVSALIFGAAGLYLTSGEVDADIPPDRARVMLADRLRRWYGAELDADARVVAAHEERGGMQGDGSEWFLVQLAPGRGPGFEADFLAGVRATPGGVMLAPSDAVAAFPYQSIEPLGWGVRLPPDARAWVLDARTGACAVFFGDKFYLYYAHF